MNEYDDSGCHEPDVVESLRRQLAERTRERDGWKERAEKAEAVVAKLLTAWRHAKQYDMPVADGSPAYRAAKHVLDAFRGAAEAAVKGA